MKKAIALLLALCILMAMTACGEDVQSTTPADSTGNSCTEGTSPVQMEGKKITGLTYFYEDDFGIYENKFVYSEDGLTLSCYEGNQLLWERSFYPGSKQLKYENVYESDGNLSQGCEYDENGLVIAESYYDYSREKLIRKDMIYNDAQLLTGISVSDGSDEHFLLESTEYDEAGQVVEYINRTDEWLAMYGSEDDEESQTSRETWSYNEAGLPVEYYMYVNDAEMVHETWVYDDAGNELENHRVELWPEVESYSNTVNVYNEDGQLIESICDGDDPATSWDYHAFYTYDQKGNLIQEAADHEDWGEVIDTWTYDENGNLLTSVTHYNVDGWVACLTENSYNDQGQLVEEIYRETYGEEIFMDQRTTWTYNEAGQLVEEATWNQDEEINRISYAYDTQGNLIEMQEYEDGELLSHLRWSYDEAGKLLDVATTELESLAARGDELLVLESEYFGKIYIALAYETLSTDEQSAKDIQAMNQMILELMFQETVDKSLIF